jgi:putative aminopeptidase FrvX
MQPEMNIDLEYLLDILARLIRTPSPTGMAEAAIAVVEAALDDLGLSHERTMKGAAVCTLEGRQATRPRALTSHVDTLGAMVKEIKSNGRLKMTKIGGFAWNTVEGEGCLIHRASGDPVRGSILLTQASAHVHSSKVNSTTRDDEHMEVRLDERVSDAEQTRALGIEVGDFISFDPRLELGPSGFIRARHLDDKASVACVLAALKALQAAGLSPSQRCTFHFSNYEEVGHGGAAGFPDDLAELVAVDMAAVGEGQASDEFHTTICIKDSGGPYHIDLTRTLRRLAEAHSIPYKVDIYPYYRSDAEAYWDSGADVMVALIGPGVDASHNYERTHQEALLATARLIVAYLLNPVED